MDSGYVNHVGFSPATASWIYQHEHPRPIHYASSGHYQRPDLYEPMPIFPYPGRHISNFHQTYSHDGTIMMNYTNSMPYVCQIIFFQHPSFYLDSLRFEDSIPMAMAHTQGTFAGNFIVGVNQPGSFHYCPEWSDYQLCPPYHTGDWPRTWVNNGITYGIYPRVTSNQFNFFPLSNDALQHYYPLLNQRSKGQYQGDFGNAMYINEDLYSSFGGSFTSTTNAFTPRLTDLPNTINEPRLSIECPSCNSGLHIPKQRRSYSQRQNGYKNKFRNFPTKSSIISLAVRASGSNRWEKKSGQPQRSKLTQSSKDHSPPVESSGTHKISAPNDPELSVKRSGVILKNSAPRHVWRRKTKTEEPSASHQPEDSESSSEQDTPNFSPSGNLYEDFESSSEPNTPNFHITWDGFDEGFDEPCEPVGQDCDLCHVDLSYALTDYESEEYYDFEPPNNLPEVAILPCRHAFHSHCLQMVTPEEKSIDPPCSLCSNYDDL